MEDEDKKTLKRVSGGIALTGIVVIGLIGFIAYQIATTVGVG